MKHGPVIYGYCRHIRISPFDRCRAFKIQFNYDENVSSEHETNCVSNVVLHVLVEKDKEMVHINQMTTYLKNLDMRDKVQVARTMFPQDHELMI